MRDGWRRRSWVESCTALLLFFSTSAASADVAIEAVGGVEVLEEPFARHRIWAADASGGRLSLVDLDGGAFLGQINTGWGMPNVVFPRARPEIHVPETYYSRGTRGVRTDVASIYDAVLSHRSARCCFPPTSDQPSRHRKLGDLR